MVLNMDNLLIHLVESIYLLDIVVNINWDIFAELKSFLHSEEGTLILASLRR